jgi:restriction system protein
MARRTRKSGFDDAVEVFSRLPWYVCVGLAVFAYALLHQLSQIAIPAASSPAHAASVMVATVAKTAGFIGQYLVPLIFLVSALVSWLSQRRRTRLLHEAESRTSSAPLRQMSWRDFERLVGAHFERLGYSVSLTPDGADGGVDVIARKGHETFLIQCKQWRATQVGGRGGPRAIRPHGRQRCDGRICSVDRTFQRRCEGIRGGAQYQLGGCAQPSASRWRGGKNCG